MDRKQPPETLAPQAGETSIYLERAIARSECEVTRQFLQRILGKIDQAVATPTARRIDPPGTQP